MQVFTVAEATEKDISAVMDIAEACGLSYWSERDLKEEIALEKSIFLRLLDNTGSCVGFILGRVVPGVINDRDADLYNIGVMPDERKKGGGELLLNAFLHQASELGAKSIWLDVRISNNTAIDFYIKFGFTNEGKRKTFYHDPVEDALLMNLKIPKPDRTFPKILQKQSLK